MAKEKTLTNDTQPPVVSDQQIAEERVEQQKPKVEQKKPEIVLIGLEAFASAKGLEWPIKVRLSHYAEQNNIAEKTFEEWEKIVAQL